MQHLAELSVGKRRQDAASALAAASSAGMLRRFGWILLDVDDQWTLLKGHTTGPPAQRVRLISLCVTAPRDTPFPGRREPFALAAGDHQDLRERACG